ncbi:MULTISPECIES: hypothetical protein [unclassified Sedimentibacter]|uniref:hypothetical protein n=1 Tax=unclassified Sedimentibacter TaxID=2649220 RepID=UPI0027E07845|nr:hypothetical protein [Sedimentibacter sp. MB35-C1]WMJ77679.1 hypothetical protein RBQ61_01770 [Sedimentibacter sp. MB35-C1]
MKRSLYEYFKLSQKNNEEYIIYLYHKFLPMIKKFGRKLNYEEEAESDLTIFLLEFIKNIDLNKFKNRGDGEIVNYIYSAFNSKYINILKTNIRKKIDISTYETEFVCYDCYSSLELTNLFSLIKNLSTIQKKIILGKFYYGYSDIELSQILRISRQAIYKQKKKAFALLKIEILKAGDELYGRKIV